jgi:hypothetical protein
VIRLLIGKTTIFEYTKPGRPEKRANINKTFAPVIQSLSLVITQSLPAALRDSSNPKPADLWAYLKKNYSAQNNARQAALVQELFRTIISEDIGHSWPSYDRPMLN